MIATKPKKHIQDYFRREPVMAIYLFGSRTKNKQGPLSDMDFAILFSHDTSSAFQLEKKIIYFSIFSKLFSIPEEKVDIVNLNDVPFPIAFSAIKGKLLYEKNKMERVNFEVKTMAKMATDFYFINRDYKLMIDKIKKGKYFYGT